MEAIGDVDRNVSSCQLLERFGIQNQEEGALILGTRTGENTHVIISHPLSIWSAALLMNRVE